MRKATFQADVPMLDAEGEVGYGGGESDLLYGCTKCRYLRAGCTSCRHKPSMERDAKIRWRPEKGRPQLVGSPSSCGVASMSLPLCLMLVGVA